MHRYCTCMANGPLLPAIKKIKEENFMWKEAFSDSFCIQIELAVALVWLSFF